MKHGRSKKAASVFESLGFSRDESEHLRVRAELLAALQEVVRQRGLKQADAASALGISQPRVSNLLAGRIDLFSTDALIQLLGRVGVRVRITLKRSKRSGRVA